MIKCLYDECQYPDCDGLCGLVPTGNIESSSSDFDPLIAHLQHRIDTLRQENSELRQRLSALSSGLRKLQIEASNIPTGREERLARACLHGYIDCIHNPEYIRQNYPSWWVELGMPTECKEESCYYDDEDK